MGTENLILKIRLLFLAWFNLQYHPGPPSFLRRYSYKNIKKATEGFRRVIYNSSQGDSYKATFQNGHVATVKEVKLLDEGDDSFYQLVHLLGCLHHRHIVSLYGFSTGPKRFLVFEHMEKGTLKEHLSDPLRTPLNWRTRLQIAVSIAAAVCFCDPPVYHISISSSSIILDENLIPKISDIGLLNAAGNNATLRNSNSSSCSKQRAEPRCKNIIFQLGLVILELITGQSSEKGGVDLVQWIQESNFPRSIHQMIDPDLGNNYDPRELDGLLRVARLCITSVDKTTMYNHQILLYLQKKIGITRNK